MSIHQRSDWKAPTSAHELNAANQNDEEDRRVECPVMRHPHEHGSRSDPPARRPPALRAREFAHEMNMKRNVFERCIVALESS